MSSFFFFSIAEKGNPTTILCNLYIESFGNIEEANMVCIVVIFWVY